MPKKKPIVYSSGKVPKTPIPLDNFFKAQTVGLVNQINDANSGLNFVQRAVDMRNKPVYDVPSIRNNDGTRSTHLMMSGEADGAGVVFPTIIQDKDGNMVRLTPEEANEYSKKTGEAIFLDSPEQANWYAENYKTTFKNGGKMKYCSGGKMKYDKGGFWSAVGDAGKTLVDLPLSIVGAKDVIGDDDYNTQFFKSVNTGTGAIAPIAGQIAANIVAPGVGGMVLGAAQNVGSALNPTEQLNKPDMLKTVQQAIPSPVLNTPTYVLANGGSLNGANPMVNSFNGPSHEDNGIAIGQNNEVEGGETSVKDYIFSDTLKVPGTKVTFAQMSKRISTKYGRRQNDAMSDKAQARELEQLKSIQEEVKFEEDARAMQQLADTNPQLFQQMTGKAANPAVQDLMPGTQPSNMVDVPMQQLRNGGKMVKSQSTILGSSSPGVTMELIRSGRHYVDTLVEVTHRRRRRYASGGSIHIDPEKKGTFTAAAAKHGESVQGFASQVLANKEDYSPAMVKKAVFAQNSRRWKHDYGGSLYFNPLQYNNDLNMYLSEGDPTKKEQRQAKRDMRFNIGVLNDQLKDGTITQEEYDTELVNLTSSNNEIDWTGFKRFKDVPTKRTAILNNVPTEDQKRVPEIDIITGEGLGNNNIRVPIENFNKLHQTISYENEPNQYYNPTKEALKMTLRNQGLLPDYVGKNKLINNPDVVDNIYNNNITGTKNPLESAASAGAEADADTGKKFQEYPTGAIIGQGLQGLGTIARGVVLAARNKYMPAEYEPVNNVRFDRVNAREPLAQSKSAFAGVNKSISQNAGSAGQYLSNRLASGVGEGMQRAGIVEQVNNQNAQIQANEAQVNANIAMNNAARKLQVGEINQQEYDSVTQAWNDYLKDIITVGSGVTKDALGYRSQNIALENLGTSNYDFSLNRRGKVTPTLTTGSTEAMYMNEIPTTVTRNGSVATAAESYQEGGIYNTVDAYGNTVTVQIVNGQPVPVKTTNRRGGYLRRKQINPLNY